MSTYAPSVIRHGLPGQIYVAAPLAVIPAGFTLGGRNVSLCPSRREAALSAHRGKSAAVRPRPACSCEPAALRLGALGGGRSPASSGTSRSRAVAVLQAACCPSRGTQVRVASLPATSGLVALLASTACLSLHAVTVLRGWRLLLLAAAGRPRTGAGSAGALRSRRYQTTLKQMNNAEEASPVGSKACRGTLVSDRPGRHGRTSEPPR